MTAIEASVERARHIDAPLDDVWEVVSDVRRLGELVPDVQSHEPVDDGWHWVLEPTRRMGVVVQPRFTVQYETEPPTHLRFERVVREGDSAGAGGACVLRGDGSGTHVTFRLDIGLDLGVPALLAAPVRAILHEEIARLAEGFLANLEDTTAAS